MLPLAVIHADYYQSKIPLAKKYLQSRDPDDIHLAALAFKDQISIWSNDKDFTVLPIEVYSTKKLLDSYLL